MSSHEPKPCPFCGRNPSVYYDKNTCTGDLHGFYATLQCTCLDDAPSVVGGGKTKTEAFNDAAQQWNTRPIEDRLNAIIAAQAQYIDRLESSFAVAEQYIPKDSSFWEPRIGTAKLIESRINESRAALDALRAEVSHG
ncbi:Lar family restriction alleviation protein [Desulfovibrio sp. OttesenSCG-928-A18]|nr:Lar family restriction alleviation protein [Desulfovibrio sp. OttesenSCG-928-A18]